MLHANKCIKYRVQGFPSDSLCFTNERASIKSENAFWLRYTKTSTNTSSICMSGYYDNRRREVEEERNKVLIWSRSRVSGVRTLSARCLHILKDKTARQRINQWEPRKASLVYILPLSPSLSLSGQPLQTGGHGGSWGETRKKRPIFTVMMMNTKSHTRKKLSIGDPYIEAAVWVSQTHRTDTRHCVLCEVSYRLLGFQTQHTCWHSAGYTGVKEQEPEIYYRTNQRLISI